MKLSDFYLQVTALPLLQGISAKQILHMQERKALRIISMEPEEGDIIVKGQKCKTLTMLMQGTLLCITQGDGWKMEEEIHAPAVIEEEALWSLTQTYKRTYRPKSEGQLLVIDRQHIMQTMLQNDIFRINLLTRMSARLERQYNGNMQPHAKTIEQKIEQFLAHISSTATTPKRLHIKMTTLAAIICETRLNVSRALRRIQEEGTLTLSREKIIINRILPSQQHRSAEPYRRQ